MRECDLFGAWPAVVAVFVAILFLSCHSSEWRVLTTESNPDAVPVLSLVFTDALHGWAATSAHLLESKDGGKNWDVRLSEPNVSLQAIYFQNADKGWIVGGRRDGTSQKGAIWQTADGGRTWSESETDVPGPLLSISFCSASLGFAVGPEQILRTTDGGHTWPVSFRGLSTEHHLGVSCSGSSEASVIDSKNVVHRTVDGGESWDRVGIREPVTDFTKIYFAERTGWILGHEGLLLRSDDGGETWKRLSIPTVDVLMDIRVNGMEGWIVGMRGTILRSLDGGMTWRNEESPTDRDLTSLCLIAQNDGWAGGSQMTVLRFSR